MLIYKVMIDRYFPHRPIYLYIYIYIYTDSEKDGEGGSGKESHYLCMYSYHLSDLQGHAVITVHSRLSHLTQT